MCVSLHNAMPHYMGSARGHLAEVRGAAGAENETPKEGIEGKLRCLRCARSQERRKLPQSQRGPGQSNRAPDENEFGEI